MAPARADRCPGAAAGAAGLAWASGVALRAGRTAGCELARGGDAGDPALPTASAPEKAQATSERRPKPATSERNLRRQYVAGCSARFWA